MVDHQLTRTERDARSQALIESALLTAGSFHTRGQWEHVVDMMASLFAFPAASLVLIADEFEDIPHLLLSPAQWSHVWRSPVKSAQGLEVLLPQFSRMAVSKRGKDLWALGVGEWSQTSRTVTSSYRPVVVCDVEQTTGRPLRLLHSVAHVNVKKSMIRVCERLGITLDSESPIPSSVNLSFGVLGFNTMLIHSQAPGFLVSQVHAITHLVSSGFGVGQGESELVCCLAQACFLRFAGMTVPATVGERITDLMTSVSDTDRLTALDAARRVFARLLTVFEVKIPHGVGSLREAILPFHPVTPYVFPTPPKPKPVAGLDVLEPQKSEDSDSETEEPVDPMRLFFEAHAGIEVRVTDGVCEEAS